MMPNIGSESKTERRDDIKYNIDKYTCS